MGMTRLGCRLGVGAEAVGGGPEEFVVEDGFENVFEGDEPDGVGHIACCVKGMTLCIYEFAADEEHFGVIFAHFEQKVVCCFILRDAEDGTAAGTEFKIGRRASQKVKEV